MVAAMYTPSVQLRASVTSGTVVERRPPKMKASIFHAGRVVPGLVERRVVGGGHGEAGVGWWLPCGRPCRPRASSPCPASRSGGAGMTPVSFPCPPTHVAVIGQRDVGEDHVLSRLAMQLGLVW